MARCNPITILTSFAVTLVAVALTLMLPTVQAAVGVNYGRDGDNLPKATDVVTLLQGRGVKHVKIFDANSDVLNAFANSGIDVFVTISNDQVASMADDQSAATTWVSSNVHAYASTTITYIGVGNEYLGNSAYDSSKLIPAIENVQTAVQNAGLASSVKVVTPHQTGILATSYPPSNGAFEDAYATILKSYLDFCVQNGSPMTVNVYPYIAYADPSNNINLDYALFNTDAPTQTDSGNGKTYTNLFDATVDAVVAAMGRVGSYESVPIMITESGWPSGPSSSTGASVANAQTYNNNLVKHVLSGAGTPVRPSVNMDTYIFALFNENKKTGAAIEQYFGLYNVDETPVYNINFSP
jgi:exo-beta-1,3-glucanase (GH17 family)